MSNSSGGEVGSFFAGFLVGGLVGAAAALLLAPQSGEETQAEIRERATAFKNEANNRLETGRSTIKKSIDEQRLAIADWLEQGADMLDQGAKEVQP